MGLCFPCLRWWGRLCQRASGGVLLGAGPCCPDVGRCLSGVNIIIETAHKETHPPTNKSTLTTALQMQMLIMLPLMAATSFEHSRKPQCLP